MTTMGLSPSTKNIGHGDKEDKVSEKTFTITEDRLRAMAAQCGTVKQALAAGFPEADLEPQEEWVDITSSCRLGSGSSVFIYDDHYDDHRGNGIGWINNVTIFVGERHLYKLEGGRIWRRREK